MKVSHAPWSKEEISLLEKSYQLPKDEIEKLFPDRSWGSITNKLNMFNLKRPFISKGGKRWTINEVKIIKENYLNIDIDKLCEMLPDRNRYAIRSKALTTFGYKVQKHRCCCDVSPLLDETNLAYYWMGFLLADGSFCKRMIATGVAEQDYHHLHKLCDFVKYTGSKKDGPMDNIKFGGKKIIAQIIEKFNITSNKTYNPPDLTKINKNKDLFLSLVIGFIDGDGCISVRKCGQYSLKIQVHGSWLNNLYYIYNFLHEYFNIAPSTYVPFFKTVDRYELSILCIFNSILLQKLKSKAVEFNLPFLNRKWDKIDEYDKSVTYCPKKVIGKDERILYLKHNNVPILDIANEFNTNILNMKCYIKRLEAK